MENIERMNEERVQRIRKLDKAAKIVGIVYLFTIPWTWGMLIMLDFDLTNTVALAVDVEEQLRGYGFMIKLFFNTMVLNMLLGFPALVLITGKLTKWKGFPGIDLIEEQINQMENKKHK